MIDPLVSLGRGCRELATTLGVSMDSFLVDPDLDGDEHMVRVIFVLPKVEDDEESAVAELLASIDMHENVIEE